MQRQESARSALRACARALFVLLALAGPASAATFTGTMSGTWWNPQRAGEGQLINFESAGGRNVVFLAYFTYDSQGRASWLAGNADFTADATTLTIPLIRGSGGVFGAGFAPAAVTSTPAGTATLEYVSCAQMRFRYAGDVAFAFDLTRAVGPLAGDTSCQPPAPAATALDRSLRTLIDRNGLTGDPAAGRVLPGIDAPLARLGKLLFFSKALSANLDVACATCHHPRFGGADGLALPIGAGASSADVVGPGRRRADGAIRVFRNGNTFFNTALLDSGLFWDSRIESLGKLVGSNGAGSGIRTPDSAFGSADAKAGPNLLAAQARFPITGADEMRGAGFPGMSDDAVRQHVAARLGDYGSGAGLLTSSRWLDAFRAAFGSSGDAASLVTFDNIMLAIAEYERSAVFVDSPWARYVRGDLGAIGADAKAGALVFYRRVDEGGGHCVQCHKGDVFTDERHHVLGFPQIGPGAGDPASDDFGRERQSAASGDRYRYRTPSLLNVELTAPYGHSGAYATLDQVFAHYAVPRETVNEVVNGRLWCQFAPFDTQTGCTAAQSTVQTNTNAAFGRMTATRIATPNDAMPEIDLAAVPVEAIGQMTAFLRTLTDPCLRNRSCYGRWIPTPDEAPDAHQLNARNASGEPL